MSNRQTKSNTIYIQLTYANRHTHSLKDDHTKNTQKHTWSDSNRTCSTNTGIMLKLKTVLCKILMLSVVVEE